MKRYRYGLTIKPPLCGRWQRAKTATSTLPQRSVAFWLRRD